MTIIRNPLHYITERTGDIEQMIADIDRVEETPATRYRRKAEIAMSISPYGKLRPYQRDFIESLRAKRKAYVDRDRDVFEFPGRESTSAGIAREQQFASVRRAGERPLQVVVISSSPALEAAIVTKRNAIERELEMHWIDLCEAPPVEAVKTVDDIVNQIYQVTGISAATLGKTNVPSLQRLGSASITDEQEKRKRAPRKR